MSDERTSWTIKDAAIVQELRLLMELTEAEGKLLGSLQPRARQVSEALVDNFYQRLLAHEYTREFITDTKRLGTTLTNWFCELFGGQYDDAYALKRLNIGLTHVRIGLPVRYPLAMIDLVSKYGEVVASTAGPDAITAFRKVLALDVATFNQAYENNQLHHLAELTGSERLARRLLTGS